MAVCAYYAHDCFWVVAVLNCGKRFSILSEFKFAYRPIDTGVRSYLTNSVLALHRHRVVTLAGDYRSFLVTTRGCFHAVIELI